MTLIPPWAYAAGAAVLVAASFGAGWQVRAWRCDAQVAALERTINAAVDRQRDRLDQSAATAETIRDQADTRLSETRTIIRETYREIPVPSDCALRPAAADGVRAAIDAANRATTGQPSPAMPDTASVARTRD